MTQLNHWQKLPETEKRERVTAMVADLAPYDVELHLSTNSELPKKYGKAIKAAGGRYSEARGTGCMHRYVHLPNTARELINKLVAEFGFPYGARSNDKVTMIARPYRDNLPTHVAVGGVAKACEDPINTFERRLARKVLEARANGDSCGELTNGELTARDQRLREAIADQEAQQKLGALLSSASPRTIEEFDGLVEALAAFVAKADDTVNVDNNVALAHLDGMMKLLERAKAARIEFEAPKPTLAESLNLAGLPSYDTIVQTNSLAKKGI